jgi:membrane protein DedA with SNARE-associated domain
MISLGDQLADIIREHHAWAGPLVGLLAFGESLAIVGILLPGTAVLVVAGGLVGAGIIDPAPVLLGAAIGAALGDAVSYYAGAFLGRRVVYRWPLIRYRRSIALARLFFRRFGFAAIFVGRFFGPVRSTVPLVAGMTGMGWRRFQIANVASAVVWAPVVLAPGWLVARGATDFLAIGEADWLGVALVGLSVVLVIAAVVLLVRRRTKSVAGRDNRSKPGFPSPGHRGSSSSPRDGRS